MEVIDFTMNPKEIIEFSKHHVTDMYRDDSTGKYKKIVNYIILKSGVICPVFPATTTTLRPLYIKDNELRQSKIAIGIRFDMLKCKLNEAVRKYNKELLQYISESGLVHHISLEVVECGENYNKVINMKYMSDEERVNNLLASGKREYAMLRKTFTMDGYLILTNGDKVPFQHHKNHKLAPLSTIWNSNSFRLRVRVSDGYGEFKYSEKDTLEEAITRYNERIYCKAVRDLDKKLSNNDKVRNLINELKIRSLVNMSSSDRILLGDDILKYSGLNFKRKMLDISRGKLKPHNQADIINELLSYLEKVQNAGDYIVRLGEMSLNEFIRTKDTELLEVVGNPLLIMGYKRFT